MGAPTKKGIVLPLNRAADSLQALARLAMIDDVTGLNNRRFLFNYLDKTLAGEEQAVLSMVMIDLDHFKTINDGYGHLCGDAVLASFASFLKAHLRKNDIAIRYAGDEFVILFPETHPDEAIRIMNRLCGEAANQTFAGDLPGRRVAVTFSAGVAGFPEDALNGRDLVRRADSAVYFAKQRGRNRVCSAGEISVHPALPIEMGNGFKSGSIFGRDRELNILEARLQLATRNHGQIILFSGEAGIGKTRCANYIQQMAVNAGFIVFAGRCYEHTASMPYWALTDLLRDSLISGGSLNLEQLAGYLPSLVHLLPELDSLAAGAPLMADPLRPEERNQFFSGICRFLLRLSEDTPLILRIDDLHWVDTSTAHFLAFLARQMMGHPIMILATYRPEEIGVASSGEHALNRLKSQISTAENYTHLVLERLSQKNVTNMIRSIFNVEKVSDSFASFIFHESEGNPFFVEQILQTLYEDGAIMASPGGWDRKHVEHMSLPPSIRELFQRRLGLLDEKTREVLAMAAILGEAFDFETLMELSGLNEGYLLDLLDEAFKAHLIEEIGNDGDRYRFSHVKIVQVLCEDMNSRRRRWLHHQAALVLERRESATDYAADLSRHYMEYGDFKKAWQYSLAASERAESLLAYQEALNHLNRAESLLNNPIDVAPEECARLWKIFGRVLYELGQYAEAKTALGDARSYYLTQGDMTVMVQIETLLATCDERCGEYESALQHLEQARQYSKTVTDPAVISRLFRVYGAVALQKGDMQAALEYALRQLDAAKEAQSKYDVRRAVLLLGSIHFECDRYSEADGFFQEGLGLSSGMGDSVEARFINNLGVLAFSRGEWDASQRYYQKGLEIARRLGDVQLESILIGNFCELYIHWGLYKEAESAMKACEQFAITMGSKDLAGHTRCHHGLLQFKKQSFQKALGYFDEALAIFRQMDAKKSISQTLLYRAASHASLGRFEEAQNDLWEGQKLAVETEGQVLKGLACMVSNYIACLRGEWSDALRRLPACLERFTKLQRPYDQGLCHLIEATARFETDPDHTEARKCIHRAMSLFEQLRAPAETALANAILKRYSA